jgi:hypothetical protein
MNTAEFNQVLESLSAQGYGCHMPYLYNAPSGPVLFFSVSGKEFGNLHLLHYLRHGDTEATKVAINYDGDVMACCPFVHGEHLKFVATVKTGGAHIFTPASMRLEDVFSGTGSVQFNPIADYFWAYYEDDDFYALSDNNETAVIYDKSSGEQHMLRTPNWLFHFYRIVRCDGYNFLLTGGDRNNPLTYLVNLDTGEQNVVSVGGSTVYKSHIADGKLAAQLITSPKSVRIFDEFELNPPEYQFEHKVYKPGIRTSAVARKSSKGMSFWQSAGSDSFYIPERTEIDLSRVSKATEAVEEISGPVTWPTISELTKNFSGAIFRWARAGLPTVSEEQYRQRLSVCEGCEHWDERAAFGLGRCKKCGCTGLKHWLETEHCPVSKW